MYKYIVSYAGKDTVIESEQLLAHVRDGYTLTILGKENGQLREVAHFMHYSSFVYTATHEDVKNPTDIETIINNRFRDKS